MAMTGIAAVAVDVAVDVVEAIGARVRAVAGRPGSVAADRHTGVAALLAVGVLVAAGGVPALLALAAVAAAVAVRRRRRARRAGGDIARTLPDAVDLLRLGAGSGLTVAQVVAAVADHAVGPVATRAAAVVASASRGVRLADALGQLRDDPTLVALADALVDAERYGTPLDRSLERLAADARGQRRRDADVRARRLPVQLLAPLVVCALPATVVLAVVPVVVVSVDGIAW